MKLRELALGILAIGVGLGPTSAYSQGKAIDVNKSTMKVRVFKSGAFSAFAHDHEIEAPIAEGKIDSSAKPSVQLRVDSRKMRVLDPEIAADKRAEFNTRCKALRFSMSRGFQKFPTNRRPSPAMGTLIGKCAGV
jgi:hypothetical protein